MPEIETAIAAYEEVVKVFKSLKAITSVIEQSQRQKILADGTKVVIDRHKIPDLTHGGLLDTLYASIGDCSFSLNRFGLISFSLHPTFIKIGELDIPAFDHSLNVNWNIISMPTESHAVFRDASRPLVDWLNKVIEEGHYSAPPVTIS